MKSLKAILLTLLHLLFFVTVHEIGVRLAPLVFETVKSNLQWGITLKFSLAVFSVLSLIMSLLYEWIDKKKYQNFILISACLIFIGIFIGDAKYTPYRTLLIMLSGSIGLIAPVFIRRKWIFQKNKK